LLAFDIVVDYVKTYFRDHRLHQNTLNS